MSEEHTAIDVLGLTDVRYQADRSGSADFALCDRRATARPRGLVDLGAIESLPFILVHRKHGQGKHCRRSCVRGDELGASRSAVSW